MSERILYIKGLIYSLLYDAFLYAPNRKTLYTGFL
jgi:hypothetical protein